jgi:hypothetical protein
MSHLRSRRRLALAVPVALSLTASLGFLPAAAQAAPRAESASQAAAADTYAYLVNTKTDPYTIKSVKAAIKAAGGSVVVSYDRIGVVVVHSTDLDFAKKIRKVRGVQSAGASRTSPVQAAGTTDEGAVQYLSKAESAKVAKGATAEAHLTLDKTPPLGSAATISVNVAPVPGEKKTDNNRSSYSALFERGTG